MLDLWIDFATVVNALGVPAYFFLLLAERKLGLPMFLTVILTIFCVFGALNHGFQAYALYEAEPFDWKDLEQDDIVALFWVQCMIFKSLTLNILAAAAWVYGAELREKAKNLRFRDMEQNQREVRQNRRDDGY